MCLGGRGSSDARHMRRFHTGNHSISRASIMIRFIHNSLTAVLGSCLALTAAAAFAQTAAPAAAPQTFWNWMGVPKNPLAGCINRGGNFPGSEKKPPLKAIADPANLQSDNPAIKKAAEIKAQEDLAAQKIKALKYLATIGCGGCYEGVDKAIAAALEDCTEAVRYEAVKTILAASECGQSDCVKKCVRKTKTCKEAMCDCWVGCMKKTCATLHLLCGKPGPDGATLKSKCPGYGCGAGGQCQPGRCACGDGNCCTSEILNKLSTMAFEKDDRGCWKEPSPRVRAMARQALRACGPNIRPYTDAPMPMPEEVPATPDAPEQVPARPAETAPEQSKPAETAPGSAATGVESDPLEVALPSSTIETAPEATLIDTTNDDPSVLAEVETAVRPDVAVQEPSAAAPPAEGLVTAIPSPDVAVESIPVAPSPDDLFPEAEPAAPRPIRPTATKPARPRLTTRLGAVVPTAGIFQAGRSQTK